MDSEKMNERSSSQESVMNERDIHTAPVITFNRDNLIKHSSKKVSQRAFINAINYVHFVQGNLFAHMVSSADNKEFLVKVFPEPCQEEEVICRVPEDCSLNLDELTLHSLIVDDGKAISLMPIDPIHVDETSFRGKIQKNGYVFTERQGKRFHCYMVSARIKQDNLEATGVLEDFTLSALRIILNKENGVTPGSFDENEALSLSLYREGKLVFSGSCKILRGNTRTNSLILQPLNFNQTRFKERKLRNPRLNLIPTPKITFRHPFNGKRVTYEIFDLTTAGFSVNERIPDALMLPGLVIPEVSIIYAGGLKLRCSVQVVYGLKQKKNTIRFGFAIYDLDIMTYNKLFDIFSSASDIHANVTSEVDMDSLWEFFFESGFIYPKKYETLSQFKDDFKKTYLKLYHNSPEIFANFTYQQNGIIYGHVSIIKAYEATWMIHHLAAKPMGRKRTGLYVLNHILNYFDGLYRMPSVGMDYMIFYFRPNNRFPDYFFGGFCREMNNPRACSMDCFAYLSCSLYQGDKVLPDGWSIQDCIPEDIQELRNWYSKVSGGLMVDALCLDHTVKQDVSLENMYASHGLKRRWFSSVLKYEGELKAFFIVDQSNMGVNLSELLNSIKIIVLDDTDLNWNILNMAICSVASVYKTEKIPIMIYPYEYMDNNNIAYDKKYNLWALNAQFGDDYTEHLKQKAKINIIKFLFKYMKSTLLKK